MGLGQVGLRLVNFLLEDSNVVFVALQGVLIHLAAEIAGLIGQQFISFGRTLSAVLLLFVGIQLLFQLGDSR